VSNLERKEEYSEGEDSRVISLFVIVERELDSGTSWQRIVVVGKFLNVLSGTGAYQGLCDLIGWRKVPLDARSP
jgi:hypothetical protein